MGGDILSILDFESILLLKKCVFLKHSVVLLSFLRIVNLQQIVWSSILIS